MKKQYKKLVFEIVNTSSSLMAASVSGPGNGGTNDTPGIHGQSKSYLFDDELDDED